MKYYYIYSDLVYGTYVVERTDEHSGKICGILKYPLQRAPANTDVVREIMPYEKGTVKFFNFDNQPRYFGELMSYADFQTAAIEAAIAETKGDGAVLKILCRHLYALPTCTNVMMKKVKALTRKKVRITND